MSRFLRCCEADWDCSASNAAAARGRKWRSTDDDDDTEPPVSSQPQAEGGFGSDPGVGGSKHFEPANELGEAGGEDADDRAGEARGGGVAAPSAMGTDAARQTAANDDDGAVVVVVIG